VVAKSDLAPQARAHHPDRAQTMLTINFKRGDTFRLTGAYKENG